MGYWAQEGATAGPEEGAYGMMDVTAHDSFHHVCDRSAQRS